ncbi:hypothetical protein HK097_000793 [Rhizophlyctis rosea]|uniref:Uncharacterized protein n=1 Tax=Rhizophlyctis rosea TaxID=64517 RepID=A0AAD5S6X5_9FUNG|nr:hypothetical protein HK097_000793 [Rhizophlyctis rosea]
MDVLDLVQTTQYFKDVSDEYSVAFDNEVVGDILNFTGGNIAFITTCAHLILKHRKGTRISMQDWEKVKLTNTPDFLASHNRMVKHIIKTINQSLKVNEHRRFLINLIKYKGFLAVFDHQLTVADLLFEAGMVRYMTGRTLKVASPYLQTLLIHRLYRRKENALKLVDAEVVAAPFCQNRETPSEAIIQAELYAAFKSIADNQSDSPITYATYLEVKHGHGDEQRLDLVLQSESMVNFAGFEVKVNLLRPNDVKKAVESQASKYKNFHAITDMFLLDFVLDGHHVDEEMPGRVQDVQCIYVRFDAKFQNLRIFALGLFDERRL